jgi:type VI secretion system protein VasJ
MNLLDLGKTPISEQTPAGTDARSGTDLDGLSSEVEKLSSPTASSGTDWRKIADLSAKILSEQSKDLLVACYLSAALLRLEGLEGFGKGAHILKELMENFWESMFPPVKRMRARRNALEWWLEKTASGLDGIGQGSLPDKVVTPLLEDLRSIDGFLGERMEEPPVLAGLLERIGSLQADAGTEVKPEVPPQAARVQPRPAAPVASSPAAEPQPLSGGAPENEEDAERRLRAVSQALSELASFYLSRDLFHPLGYLLDRAAAWSPVVDPPPSENSITLIPPPPEHVRTSLQDLNRKGDWENLLRSAESSVGDFLFWLDLSRWVAESLKHLGRLNLSDLVSRETAAYAERLKGIDNLCFSDGTPFVDSETKGWLKRLSLAPVGSGPDRTPDVSADALETSVEGELRKAMELFREQKLPEAVGLLHGRISKGSSGKEKLLWRTALSTLLVFAGETGTALPHLREIIRDVDHYRLEEWDPELALRALMGVYSGLISSKDEKAGAEAAEILDRIATLSPAEAMRLKT